MTRVAYCAQFGGFGLSPAAEKLLGPQRHKSRHDPRLLAVIDQLGTVAAAGMCCTLAFSEGTGPYRIEEYDGFETVVWRNRPEDFDWIDPEVEV